MIRMFVLLENWYLLFVFGGLCCFVCVVCVVVCMLKKIFVMYFGYEYRIVMYKFDVLYSVVFL